MNVLIAILVATGAVIWLAALALGIVLIGAWFEMCRFRGIVDRLREAERRALEDLVQ